MTDKIFETKILQRVVERKIIDALKLGVHRQDYFKDVKTPNDISAREVEWEIIERYANEQVNG